MKSTNKEPLFKPGHVYFMNEYDDTDETEIFDLTAMPEDKAAKIIKKALDEEREAEKAN
ncbi:MAG: hypothetical protein IJ859_01600 [Synergistaceae bacterium]|nr:hypothetical protein [Synergistaceae bacterium]MBR2207483.1 hypothetical protein [Synergistaceae bacterium]